ncbi:DUF2062 domain-containing protein [uncultured Hymenobacter sp.]|uniref:DUF2062 domain-containing protein n=1 Tax=uncultured Hymenobacter sp. TaxID=170016 RepID=UPI0035CBF50F
MPSSDLPPPPAAAAPIPTPAKTPGWLRRRLVQPLLDLLKSGLSPTQLALTVGLGVAFGLAPTIGLTTILSSATALRLRLNVAAMQLVVHVLSPLQLLLLVPLLRAGATVLGHGEEVQNLRLPTLKKLIADDGWGLLRLLWRAELGAVLIWALASVPVVALLYVGLRPIFKKVLARQQAASGEAARANE